jgi:hypothetical protein
MVYQPPAQFDPGKSDAQFDQSREEPRQNTLPQFDQHRADPVLPDQSQFGRHPDGQPESGPHAVFPTQPGSTPSSSTAPHSSPPWPPNALTVEPKPPAKHGALKVIVAIAGGVVVFGLGVATGAAGSHSTTVAAPVTKTVTVAVPGPTQTVVETLTVEPTTTQPPGPKTSVTNGTFHVGEDVVAGRWKTDGPAGSGALASCYWERERNDSGDFSAILANDNISGPASITVNPGEFVKFDGGCAWTHS